MLKFSKDESLTPNEAAKQELASYLAAINTAKQELSDLVGQAKSTEGELAVAQSNVSAFQSEGISLVEANNNLKKEIEVNKNALTALTSDATLVKQIIIDKTKESDQLSLGIVAKKNELNLALEEFGRMNTEILSEHNKEIANAKNTLIVTTTRNAELIELNKIEERLLKEAQENKKVIIKETAVLSKDKQAISDAVDILNSEKAVKLLELSELDTVLKDKKSEINSSDLGIEESKKKQIVEQSKLSDLIRGSKNILDKQQYVDNKEAYLKFHCEKLGIPYEEFQA